MRARVRVSKRRGYIVALAVRTTFEGSAMSGLRFYRCWVTCVLLVPAAASAHHSRTQYDGSEIQEIKGELIFVSWANPHAAFSVRVTSASGESATWQLESW